MTKALEILFRQKWRLLALLLLPILLGLAVVMLLPRQYQVSAGIWALRRYEIIGATGPESDLQSTPAQTQATTLSQLLQSRSFTLAVANDTDLPHTLAAANPGTQNLQDAIFTEISTNVIVTPQGYNLFQITYANKNPALALQVVQAVIKHYGTQSTSQSTAEGEELLASYQRQLTVAQQQAQQATQVATQYVQRNQLTATQALIDPEYQLLATQVTEASATVGNIEGNINTVQQQLAVLDTGSSGLYTVLDTPTVPNRPIQRTKSFLVGGAIGLVIGLIAAIGYLLVLVRLDQSLYSVADVSLTTSYPVLVQVPRIPLDEGPQGLPTPVTAVAPVPEEIVPETPLLKELEDTALEPEPVLAQTDTAAKSDSDEAQVEAEILGGGKS